MNFALLNNLHKGYFLVSLFYRSTLAMGQSNSMTDSTVKIASTVYKSCSFLDKVCFDIPKELGFRGEYNVQNL